jgi:anti-sigma regulatory factor (Ser/Thr protein kinase)
VPPIERKFKRHIDSLAQIFDFIDRFVDEEKVADDARHAVLLAVDELFTNMVKYHPLNTNDVSIKLAAEGQTMVVQLVDQNVDPFDVTKKPDPDLSGSLDDREPGGLGIFLTKKFIDNVQYQHGDRISTIILRKNFRRKNV